MKKAIDVADKIKNLIETHEKTDYEAQSRMWKVLESFVKYTLIFADMVILRACGQKDEAIRVFNEKLIPFIKDFEHFDQGALDVARLIQTINAALKPDN